MLRNLLWPVAVSLALNFRYAMTAPSGSRAVLEQLSSVPDGWEQVSPASPSQALSFAIDMISADPTGFEQTVLGLSTPDHETYGQFLSFEQVQELAKPSETGSKAVLSWLASQNLPADSIQNDGSWIRFTLTVQQAEQMLQTKYYIFRSTLSGETRVLTLSYSVPSSVASYIQMIHPTTDFSQIQGSGVQVSQLIGDVNTTSFASNAAANCNSQITPSCLENLYGLPRSSIVNARNRIAIPGFLNQYANFADLRQFLTDMRPDLKNPQPTFNVVSIDGGKNDQNTPGDEANLDIQYTVGLADRTPVTFYTVGSPNIQGFIDLANTILEESTPPTAISISYGFNEYQVSQTAAKSLCNLFMALGGRGVSVIIASGDGGVGGSRPGDTCTTFLPTFPASCPFVTAVGATAGIPETAANISAGGFSNLFARPSYQSAAVSRYLASIGSEYKGKFNSSGRGFPDVSAQGSNVVIRVGGQYELVGGTSASAPIFASTIALLNAERLLGGKAPLGFLNPLLYGFPIDVVNDITSGSNPGCGTNGFPAKLGWDPVTGLGTPNYLKMQGIVLGL